MHKGGSTYKVLYEIMLEMQEIALTRQFLIRFIHVSISRPISCGVDGLSLVYLQLETLDGEMYLHLPVDRDPIFHSSTLLTWIQSWISDPFLLAEPSDLFSRAQQPHDTSISSQSEPCVWSLPPAVDLYDLE